MKAALIALSLACCVGLLYANPLQENKNLDELKTSDDAEPQVMPAIEQYDEDVEEHERPDGPHDRPHHRAPSHVVGNAYKSQGPFSGRLTNVVLNRKGVQKTVQRNDIEFNWEFVRRHLRNLLENEDSE